MLRLDRPYLPWLVGVAAGVFYLLTLGPGALWQDAGMFQVRVLQGDLTSRLELALSMPATARASTQNRCRVARGAVVATGAVVSQTYQAILWSPETRPE